MKSAQGFLHFLCKSFELTHCLKTDCVSVRQPGLLFHHCVPERYGMSCSYLRGWQIKSRLVRGPKVRRISRSLYDFVAKNLDLMWPATGNM